MTQQHDLTTPIGVQSLLQTHGFPSCASVERLAEGFSGFVYRVCFEDNTHQPSSIIVKHVEGYAARWTEFELGQTRMDYEAKGLEFLHSSMGGSESLSVGVPRLLRYDSDNYTLIMEDAGDLPSLKSWLRADSPEHQIISIGRSLGSYLAHIHNTTANNSALKEAFDSNIIAKNLSSSVYFGALPAAAERYRYTQPFIKAAADFASNEVMTANTVWTLGDFWTGNVLVSTPNEQDKPALTVLDLELAKPGTAAFDIGQMGAEMLCLARFRYHDQGSLLLRTFLEAYKSESLGSVDAAAVAIRIGAHLVTMVPRAWLAEAGDDKVKEVVAEGIELLKMGWEKDRVTLKQSVVGSLLE